MENQKRQRTENYRSSSHEKATIAFQHCRASASLAEATGASALQLIAVRLRVGDAPNPCNVVTL